MQSIRTLYKVGKGPSSSHTMGPERAAKLFREMTPEADRYEVILYGSLAKTGIGHGTDRVLVDTLAPYPTKIVFASVDPGNMKHPNTLDLIAYKDNKETQRIRVESIGGGDIVVEGEAQHADAEVYPENSFAEIARFCQWRHVSLPEYVELNEGPEIWSFLEHIWHVMRQSIEDGLAAEGILPGGLNVQRKAKYLYERTHLLDLPQVRELQLVCSYAFDGRNGHVCGILSLNCELIVQETIRQLVVIDGFRGGGFAVFTRQNARFRRTILCDRVGHLQRHVALVTERDRKGHILILDLCRDEDGIGCAALGTLKLIAALFHVQGRAVNGGGENLRVGGAFSLEVEAVI